MGTTSRLRSRAVLMMLLVQWVAPAAAQGRGPVAAPADVATADALMAALYDVISGPAGTPRNWDRFRSLFTPGARLIPTFSDSGGVGHVVVWSVEDYIHQVGPNLERGFYEREIGRRTEAFGNVMHVFSTYASHRSKDDPVPIARGINSLQLFNDGSRWWIVSIFWDQERRGLQIPPKYLGNPR